MPKRSLPNTAGSDDFLQHVFAGALGILLGLSLLKFGNPVIVEEKIVTPADLFEWVLMPWPLAVGQILLGLVVMLGVFVARKQPVVRGWLLLAPLPWLAWQFVAAAGSVDASLTGPTLLHFCTNITCFYLGLFCLGPIKDLRWFWAGLMSGFVLVLLSGWQQHFGGLNATREYFYREIYPQMNGEVPEALARRMSSNRVFATLFYPNTLAGVILLLAPVSVTAIPSISNNGRVQRIGLMLALGLAGGCLLWSGSKAGWLMMLILVLVALFRLQFSRATKLGMAILLLTAGVAGFLWKYSGYLQRGAQSAVARLDYWEAGLKIVSAHPLTGTGPGTFGKAYAELKRPESEMAHLAHNDFIQQATDSGIPGFLGFAAFLGVTLAHTGRRVWCQSGSPHYWIWLGLLGINLQSAVEFGWYIPAIAWPNMALLGWMLASTTNALDNPKHPNLTSPRV